MAASDSYDSDGGLEEISIADSKKQFADKWYSINKQLKAEKEKLKDKRRNHHLLCSQQKKQKSKNGKVKRKSSDEDSPEKLFESYRKEENKTKRVKSDDKGDDDVDDDDKEEKEQDVVAEAENLAKKPFNNEEGGNCSTDDEDEMNKSSEDFIAFDKKDGGVKPVYIKDFMKVDRGLESALAFKNKHLFGRHVHRQPMSSHLAMAEKRRARYPKKTNSTAL